MSQQQQKGMPTEHGRITPWRVRLCRWLYRILIYVWGTLGVGILVGTIANINTTTMSTPLSKLNVIFLVLTFPLPVFASLGFLAFLTFLFAIGSRHVPSQAISTTLQSTVSSRQAQQIIKPTRPINDLTNAEKAQLATFDQAIARKQPMWNRKPGDSHLEFDAGYEIDDKWLMAKVDFLIQHQRWEDVVEAYDQAIALTSASLSYLAKPSQWRTETPWDGDSLYYRRQQIENWLQAKTDFLKEHNF